MVKYESQDYVASALYLSTASSADPSVPSCTLPRRRRTTLACFHEVDGRLRNYNVALIWHYSNTDHTRLRRSTTPPVIHSVSACTGPLWLWTTLVMFMFTADFGLRTRADHHAKIRHPQDSCRIFHQQAGSASTSAGHRFETEFKLQTYATPSHCL